MHSSIESCPVSLSRRGVELEPQRLNDFEHIGELRIAVGRQGFVEAQRGRGRFCG